MYSSMCDCILEKYWHHQVIPEKGLDGMIVLLWSGIVSCNLQYQVYLVNLCRAMDLVGFPDASEGEESAYNAGDQGLIPGLGRSPGERNPIHSSILAWRILWTEEPDRLWCMGVAKSLTCLSD